MLGSKPASWQERRKIDASGQLPVVPRIHDSSASSSSLRLRLRASGWPAGSVDVHRVVEQVQALDAVLARRPEARGDVERQIDLSRAQLGDRRLRLGGLERELDRGVSLTEAGDRLGHDRRAGARERREPQAPAPQPGDRLELGLGVGQPGEDRVGVLDERTARVGEPDAAGVALDEPGAGLAFERGDLLRDGGLGVGERIGGGGERAAGGDLAQDAHSADIEHKRTLSVVCPNVICAHAPRLGP